MINIKLEGGFLDISPNATIQRERNSPFFLSTKSGKDAIPAEVSYPFNLPLTDNNMKKLGFTNVLPSLRQKEFNLTLYDEVNQITNGKLIMRSTDFNLNGTNIGRQEANLLCNASAFFKLIEGKKLKDLTLGGPRVFSWDGFNDNTGSGFWRHCHNTWNYTNCDDGDYVFYPIWCLGYGGFSNGPNTVEIRSGRIQLAQKENVTSICPHTYVSYILRCIFEEHGYQLSGDILDDAMFKKVTLASFRGVYWSELNRYKTITEIDFFQPSPFNSITIKLNEHMPQETGIGEFLVELMKFLPLGYEIDDNSRTCRILTLGKQSTSDRLKDMTRKVSPSVQTSMAETDKKKKVIGMRYNFNSDGLRGGVADLTNLNYPPNREQNWLPLPAPVLSGEAFRLIFDAGYWAKEKIDDVYTEVRLGDATSEYAPEGVTDYIECSMAPIATRNTPGSILNTNHAYRLPVCEIEGNWVGKSTQVTFGMHIAFYHGKNYPVNNNGSLLAPYASNTNNKWQTATGGETPVINGTWSMAHKLGGYGLVEVWWSEWLKVLAENETLKTSLNINLIEYLKLKWGDEILIENTSYFIKKITDVLPFPDTVEIEAVRWIKGNE